MRMVQQMNSFKARLDLDSSATDSSSNAKTKISKRTDQQLNLQCSTILKSMAKIFEINFTLARHTYREMHRKKSIVAEKNRKTKGDTINSIEKNTLCRGL